MLFILALLALDPSPPTFRLPAGIRPTHYALELGIVPSQPEYRGSIAIDLQLDAPTSVIWLNATDLHIDGGMVVSGKIVQAAHVIPGGTDFVGFSVDTPLAAGSAKLTVTFRGTLDSEKSRGIYRVAEKKDEWYAYTFFEPIDARRAFPCFDEPGFKVPWQIRLRVKKDQVALANTPVIKEVPATNGFKSVWFAETPPLPSYLIAFVVGPFDLVDGGSAGQKHTPIRFVIPRGRAAETRYAREITPRIIVELEKFFGTPYPMAKLDVAVVPRFWGTMEHPGLVALGQPLTLIKPEDEGLRRKQSYANIAAHELAHFWFGDLVTCKWWNDVWLNESLGTFADLRVTDALEPSWKFMLGRDYASGAMTADGKATVQKLRSTVDTKDQIEDSFDNDITYAKGASVMRMLEHWLGAPQLLTALRAYLAAHAWGNADAADFIASLRTSLGPQAASVMQSFVDQPGVPIIAAQTRCDSGAAKVTLTQKRFFNAAEKDSAQTWILPVCLKWDSGARCVVLDQRSAEIALPTCPSWLVANADGAGYYRVRYDHASLASLQPVFAQLTVTERNALASDVIAEADQGTLPVVDALALAPTFFADADPRVFRRALRLLTVLNPKELGDKERGEFGKLVAQWVKPRAQSLGFAPRDNEDPELKTLRPMLLGRLADAAHDREVIAEAHKEALAWLHDRKAIAPDMVDAMLDIAGQSDDSALFDQLLAQALTTKDRQDRTTLVYALSGFRSPAFRTRQLSLVTSGELDPREAINLFYGLLAQRETRESAWAWLQQHAPEVLGKMREDDAMQLFAAVPAAFCDAAHASEIAAFLTPLAQTHSGAPHVLEEALASERDCIASTERNRAAGASFLHSYSGGR